MDPAEARGFTQLFTGEVVAIKDLNFPPMVGRCKEKFILRKLPFEVLNFLRGKGLLKVDSSQNILPRSNQS